MSSPDCSWPSPTRTTEARSHPSAGPDGRLGRGLAAGRRDQATKKHQPSIASLFVLVGGLAQFGYPLTEERWDSLPTGVGRCCVTQYFERARFEYHPENTGTPYEVLLGQFGRQVQRENDLLTGSFAQLYFGSPGVREQLGAPTPGFLETIRLM